MGREDFEKQKFSYNDILKAVKYGLNYGGEEDLNVPEGNIQQWLCATKTRTAEQWQNLFPDIKIIDPDGWDRENHKRDWYEEQLTYQEYCIRRDKSSCMDLKKEKE